MADWKNKEEVMKAIAETWEEEAYIDDVLDKVDDSLLSDKELIMTIVQLKHSGCLLDYADDSLKADKEIVMAAVQTDGYALGYADDSLRAD